MNGNVFNKALYSKSLSFRHWFCMSLAYAKMYTIRVVHYYCACRCKSSPIVVVYATFSTLKFISIVDIPLNVIPMELMWLAAWLLQRLMTASCWRDLAEAGQLLPNLLYWSKSHVSQSGLCWHWWYMSIYADSSREQIELVWIFVNVIRRSNIFVIPICGEIIS